MNLTLGVLASVLALLPGLALIAGFNFRTRRGGARRPEMQLTAVTALVLAVFFSMVIHGLAYIVADGALAFVLAVHELTGVNAGRIIANPLGAGFAAWGGQALPMREGLGLGVVLFLEVVTVANFTWSRSFELFLDTVDFNGQGWVFEHITRPAENGYTPVGHVYTSTMSGRFGIAYKGAVTDIRQDEKGQILAIALSRPERFLYEIGPSEKSTLPPRPAWRTWFAAAEAPPEDTGVRHHAKEPAGGVVSLDARIISNIVVHCISNDLLQEIDDTLPEPTADGVS
ncbi:hypothetical protein [Sphingomonas solaris]|uniref:Uncharacterized protein n=1 Tax=Alterirhizorhabdus solaris TaxID=2529389 RepID=A0A558QWE5_9SPHN|nr:hypothetical protein [Sphingomonas solaris]TVV71445.1 hypothetical protein FOY91_16755 [Sphingomonas solaris]